MRKSILIGLALSSLTLFSCKNEDAGRATAQRVTDRTQLVGGPTALGDIGDYVLENDQIKVVVQDLTYNRGSGLFGGSLIDADLKRYDSKGTPFGGTGRDTFGELFPVFFLEMIDPQQITVVNDGTDGKAAIIEVAGKGGEFVTMLRYLNQLMLNTYPVALPDVIGGIPASSEKDPQLAFTTRYILEPGARHIRIESRMTNISSQTLEFPSSTILGLLNSFLGLDLSNFRIPAGHVLGFGALSSIFLPDVGYDLRFGLDDAYRTAVPLPGFPGLLTNIVASTTTLGVNYGFVTVDDPESNFVYQRDQDGLYEGRAASDDMLMLFYASGFGGVFTSQSPQVMRPVLCDSPNVAEACGADDMACIAAYAKCSESDAPTSYGFTNYFIVGDGDVASIYEELFKIRGIKAPTVRGRIRDSVTGEPAESLTSVLFYSATDSSCTVPKLLNQVHTRSEGYFELQLAPGHYCYRTRRNGHPLSAFAHVEVGANGAPLINGILEAAGHVSMLVTDLSGQPMPAKLTLVGTHEYRPGVEYRDFLYDLSVGEPWKPTDMIPDDPADPRTRRFIEDTSFGNAQGRVSVAAPPGEYIAYISRGPEYSLVEVPVTLEAGKVLTKSVTLERVVNTEGYLSGDFHLHAAGSIDSGLDNNLRVLSAAGEGVEVAVSTDHNYVTDYKPFVARNQLEPWVAAVTGIELTTFEAGHFNTFPIERALDSQSRGSIKWQDTPPQKIFDTLRELAPEGGTIIQVNHPRTPIMGYFEQHNLNPFDTTVDLAINQATGTSKLTATLTSPSGPAFVEEIPQGNNKSIYKSTFSWDFDAIEVFNGKHFEELRHFRMPYDKTAAPGSPYALPEAITQAYTLLLTEDEKTDDVYKTTFIAELFPDLTPAEREALTQEEIDEAVDNWVFEQLPAHNTVLCDGDDIVRAGGLDDYYNLLNYARPDGTYRHYAATGNSDAHKNRIDETGSPRNYFYVGHDEPRKLKDAELVKALRDRHNIVTNGPFINLKVNQNPIGSEFSASGELEFEVTVRAAEWVGADRFRIVANGEVLRGAPQQSDDYWGWSPVNLVDGGFKTTFTATVPKDTWFVLEVEGDNNLFPVISPQDIPPFNFDAVIGSLSGAFGLGGGVEGLEPSELFAIKPFAFTNPIWVVVDGDSVFTPPSPPVFQCKNGAYVQGLTMPLSDSARLRPAQLPIDTHNHNNPLERRKGEHTPDLRMLFESFGHMH